MLPAMTPYVEGESQRFDIVSCQFSMHYGFSSEERVRSFLTVVASSLRIGGVFIGTTVDDSELLRRREQLGNSFGNSIYRVDFIDGLRDGDAPFGVGYRMSFEDSVDGALEYIVPWGPFVALAQEYRLQAVEAHNFAAVQQEYEHTAMGQQLLAAIVQGAPQPVVITKGDEEGRITMKHGADGKQSFALDPEEREAAFLYRSFMFQKRA
jgi:hypothetical protein